MEILGKIGAVMLACGILSALLGAMLMLFDLVFEEIWF